MSDKADSKSSAAAAYDSVFNNGNLSASAGDGDTLSRGNPIAEFLRMQKASLKDLSQEEFLERYEAFVRDNGNRPEDASSGTADAKAEDKASSSGDLSASHKLGESAKATPRKPSYDFHGKEGNFTNIVLKFTTLSEGCVEAPSFTINRSGAHIGRHKANQICVPSDQRLAEERHASIEFHKGNFYIVDGGHDFAASIRIGVGSSHNKKWVMEKEARFSCGNSVFLSMGQTDSGELEMEVIEGPLKGNVLKISRKGATFGRSSENAVSVPDRELSRKHSRVEFDEKLGRFVVSDMGSTNGTYVQLVGPYGGRYRLNLNDHILVGRTGFSINRFDYGVSEEMGYRQAMEDACAIVQHLNIGPLCMQDLSPQSFFGVYDGHGGVNASHYLAQHLHVNVAHSLLGVSNDIFEVLALASGGKQICDEEAAVTALDGIITPTLKECFLRTDQDFIASSANPQHGSTATTALVLGRRLYCANVGDSRTMICRNFKPMLMSQDHKPGREDEAKRIRDAGGFVINNRVMGELAVSRAFGDVDFKKGIKSIIEEEGGTMPEEGNADGASWDQPLIVAEPDIQATTLTDQDQFLLLACDGLFDVFTPEEVVTFVKENMDKHGDAQRCCQNITHEAIRKRNSRDNVSVILIILNKWY